MDMKKIILLTVVLLISSFCLAQTKQNSASRKTELERIDSLIQDNNSWLEQIELDLSLKQRYKLYQTKNIYTFLQLDTKTGMIDQFQWSLDSDNEGSVVINDVDLRIGLGYGSGTFELYPTENMYQFILLDKTTGRKWHVQWGMESSKRWIRAIY